MVREEPKQGDIIWIDFDNAQGHGQRGKRPALVVSKSYYNSRVGMALMCPITSERKGYPLEVELRESKTEGVILSDQVRNLDWQERKVEFVEQVPPAVIEEVIDKITLLIKG